MSSSMRRASGIFLTLVLALIISGCAESQRPKATGKGRIRGIAAIVDAPQAAFLIEERRLGELNYKSALGLAPYDDLSYNFSFDILLPGENDRTRLATQFIDVVADVDYTVILTGTVANPSTILWEDAEREWAGTETVFEPTFAHLSPALGPVDVYMAAPGTAPVLGNAIVTVANGERMKPGDIEEGIYEFILTAAGDPAGIVYTSAPIQASQRTRPVFAIFDADPSITSPVSFNIISESGGSITVPDPAFPSQLRIYHAAFGTVNVDAYFDDDFGNRIFTDVDFKGLTPYTDVINADTKLTLTAVNNTGAILLESNLIIPPGVKRTIALVGDQSNLFLNVLNDEPRPLAVGPVLRIANMAGNTDFIKAYLLEPGTEITLTTIALFPGLPSQLDTGYFAFEAGSFEMTITDFLDIEPIAPSILLDLASGEVVDIAILDTVDPEVFELDEFARL